jgi:hypothetical protein
MRLIVQQQLFSLIPSFVLAIFLGCTSPKEDFRAAVQTDETVRYLYVSDSTYRVQWRQLDSVRVSQDVFGFAASRGLQIADSTPSVIILKQTLGTSNTLTVFLPRDTRNREAVFRGVLNYDLNEHLVAFVNEDDHQSLVVISDYLSGVSMVVREEDICPAALKTECIDSTAFNGREFYIRWHASKWSPSDGDLRDRRVKINF